MRKRKEKNGRERRKIKGAERREQARDIEDSSIVNGSMYPARLYEQKESSSRENSVSAASKGKPAINLSTTDELSDEKKGSLFIFQLVTS